MAALVMAGCVTHFPTTEVVPLTRDWNGTMAAVQSAAVGRRFAEADSLLVDFASQFAGSPEARETWYWRALMLLMPGNPALSYPGAVSHLDHYLADTSSAAQNIAAAHALRVLAVRADSLDRALKAANLLLAERAEQTPPRPASTREEELQKENDRLKAELEKLTAELDRIRRRLTPPTRPPR
jgi:hypothetical protein